jgi:outer membrane protein assembly factor BamA
VKKVQHKIIGLIFMLTAALSASESVIKEIEDILIIGNNNTHNTVIERELLFEKGQAVSDSALEASLRRIENLMLFNRVEFKYIPANNGVTLLILITERLYIFPFPILRLEDRNWGKISYGIGMAHENFWGWNQKMYGSLVFGERPGSSFLFKDPWVGNKLHFSFGFLYNRFLMTNRLYPFDEQHQFSRLSLGRFWTRDFYTQIAISHRQISVKKEYASYMASLTQQDENTAFSISITYDKRDIHAFPADGFFLSAVISQNGLFTGYLDYRKYSVDIRKYVSIYDVILAGRVYSLQSSGNLPVYDKIFLGFDQRIRGHFNEIYEGRHIFSAHFESRIPVVKVRYFTLPATAGLPAYLTQNLKFGLYTALFIESGIAYANKREFKGKNFKNGFGAGLHFRAPYVEVVRFDYAFNEDLKGELIIEVRASF